jgi:hypothetical protein
MKLHKIFATVSLTTFLLALTESGNAIGYGILKPLSAVFFILFFIFQLLEKESALYAAENAEQMRLAEEHAARVQSAANTARLASTKSPAVASSSGQPRWQTHARA